GSESCSSSRPRHLVGSRRRARRVCYRRSSPIQVRKRKDDDTSAELNIVDQSIRSIVCRGTCHYCSNVSAARGPHVRGGSKNNRKRQHNCPKQRAARLTLYSQPPSTRADRRGHPGASHARREGKPSVPS